MKTKDKILHSALTLFSQNGYEKSSMEQIADSVGIKAPSLYKHFRSKEDILNELIRLAEERYEENFGSDRHVGKIPDSHKEFISEAMKRVTFTLKDEMIRKIRIFLVKEQFRNERLSRITSMHQIEGPQKLYTNIIAGMMEKKLFRKADPSLLAFELIAPVSLLISKADREPDSDEEILKEIRKHVRHFCEIYG